MKTVDIEKLKELLPLRICIVGDAVDKERHQIIHAFPDLIRELEAKTAELEFLKEHSAIPAPGCNYMTPAGTVCNKCGNVHSGTKLSWALRLDPELTRLRADLAAARERERVMREALLAEVKKAHAAGLPIQTRHQSDTYEKPWESCNGTFGPLWIREFEYRIDPSAKALSTAGAVEGDGWMDIATAPKDGTKIQMWWKEMDDVPVRGWWSHRDDCWDCGTSGWIFDNNKRGNPTHWRPLPKAPRKQEGEV